MTRIEAALFDVDGTLVDTVDLHAEAWVLTLREFGLPADFEDLRRQIGKGGDQLLPGLVPPDVLAVRQDEIEAHRADLFRREFLPRVRPFPAVRPLFERLRAEGLRLALASSGKADEVEHHMKLIGIEGLVDAWTSSDDAERSKPFGDIFQAAFAKLGLADPTRAVVVGDTPYDAEAARAGRFPAIGVLCGGFSEPALRAAGCRAVYRDAEHLLAELDNSLLLREGS